MVQKQCRILPHNAEHVPAHPGDHLYVTRHLGADLDPGVPGGRGPGGGGGLLPLQAGARQCQPRYSWSVQVIMT